MRIRKGNYKKTCECGCGELIWHFGAQGHPIRFVRGHNTIHDTKWIKSLPRGSEHYHWKDGRQNGEYIALWRPDYYCADGKGRVSEHRYVWEQEYNACILPWSIVHHKDRNKINNVWYNLQAMLSSTHSSIHHKKNLHRKIDMDDRFCIICGGKSWTNGKGHEYWFVHPITKQKWICYKCKRKKSFNELCRYITV